MQAAGALLYARLPVQVREDLLPFLDDGGAGPCNRDCGLLTGLICASPWGVVAPRHILAINISRSVTALGDIALTDNPHLTTLSDQALGYRRLSPAACGFSVPSIAPRPVAMPGHRLSRHALGLGSGGSGSARSPK